MNQNIEVRSLSDFNDISLLKKLYDLNQANVPEVGSVENFNDFINLLELSDDILLSYADKKMTGFVVCFYEKSTTYNLLFFFIVYCVS